MQEAIIRSTHVCACVHVRAIVRACVCVCGFVRVCVCVNLNVNTNRSENKSVIIVRLPSLACFLSPFPYLCIHLRIIIEKA